MSIYNGYNSILDYLNLNNKKYVKNKTFLKQNDIIYLEKNGQYYKQYNLRCENSMLIDKELYDYLYSDSKKHNNTLIDIYENGVETGKIYSTKQLFNNDKQIKSIYKQNKELFVDKNNNLIPLKKYVKDLYDKPYEWFINDIEIIDYDYLETTETIICSFIGNLEIGICLLNKILKSDKKKLLNIIIINSKKIYDKIIEIIDEFENKIVFLSKQFGNDIIPTLQALNYINDFDYKHVIKLHTKSDKNIFNQYVDYLLNYNINEIIYDDKSNTIGYNYLNLFNLYCKKLINSNKSVINSNKLFVPSTIFLTEKKTITNILEFIEKNNYKSYFLNNMYDPNHINIVQSPIHFLERLFGVINKKDAKNNNILENTSNQFKYYFICTYIGSGDYCVANSLSEHINNSKVITINEINNYNFKKENIVILLDNSQMKIFDINKLNCIKVAWVRNWERKWLKYLKMFDYVLCCTNKAKEYIESNGIKSYILPIGGNFYEYNFSKTCEYDILIDCNLFNRRNIVDIVLNLIKKTNYNILICGRNWNKYLTKEEFNIIKPYYKEFINYDEIKNYYLNSKIIIDDCNINTQEFGSINKRAIDCISCKRLIITNNKVGNNEIFNNALPYYDSFNTLKNVIDSYIKDSKKYNTKVNELYTYANKFLNNDKYKHVFTNLKLFQKNNTNIDLVIKICGRGKVNFTFTDSYQWGDLFMAGNIRNELYNLYGLNCQICLINDWYNYKMYKCNNILFLRGISIYNPKLENNNMVLFISHPESYTDKEFKKYNKIICCSKIFYEKIKTNLKLSEDDIIFALQPLHSSIPDKIDKEKKLEYEAVFIGNKIRERTCISGLSQTNLKKVKIYGDYWNSISTPPVLDNIKPLNSSKVNNIYKLSQIVLNDTWEDMRINGFVSDRILTALLFSNNVITDDVYGINDFKFENIYIFKDSNELNNLFEKCLQKSKNNSSKNKEIIVDNNNKLYDFIYTSLNFKIKNSETKDFYYNFTLSQINIFNKRLDQIKKEYKKNEKINIPKFQFDYSPLIKNAKVFTMVKNEMDIIPYYLKYYSSIFGIENLHIFDNNSTDGTYEYLQNIKKSYDKFNLMRTPKDFYFINKSKLITEQVNKYKNNCEFILILDCDEFIISLDNNIPKQFSNLNDKNKDNLVIRMPYYLCYNYKDNFIHNTEFIDDDKLCFRDNYAKCMFTNKSFRNLTENGNHNINIKKYLVTGLRILHFHTRGKKITLSKKINLLNSYYGIFDVEKLNKLVIGFDARHVAKELLDYIINTNNFKYSSNLNIINIDTLRNFFANIIYTDKNLEHYIINNIKNGKDKIFLKNVSYEIPSPIKLFIYESNFDSNLYCYLNNYKEKDFTKNLRNYINNDFMKGKIMSFKQIERIYPNVKRLDRFNLSFNNTIYDIKSFVNSEIINKDKKDLLFNHNIELIIKNIQTDNYDIGIFVQIQNLINIDYIIKECILSNINSDDLVFIALTDNIYDEFMNLKYELVKNISNILIIKNNNYGFDIPIFMIQLNYINKLNIEVNYILKLHSKSSKKEIERLSINITNIGEILNYLKNNNIMYFSFDSYMTSYDDYCKESKEMRCKLCKEMPCKLYFNNYYRLKYNYNDYIFLSGSIGFMKTSLIQERMKTIKSEDLALLLINNYFYKNHIFYLNSFVHFLERYLLGNVNNSDIKYGSYNKMTKNIMSNLN